MKALSKPTAIAFIIAFLACSFSHAQNISITASGVWMTDFSADTVFNVTGTLGGPTHTFTGNNLGVHVPNTHTLVFRGGQLTTHSTSGASDVCRARMYYRVYAQGSTPGAFNTIEFFFGEDCEFPPQFNSGGSCGLGDQKFDLYLPDGTTDPSPPMDLTLLPVGNYIIEVYYAIDGLTDCTQTVLLNNGGSNYTATFSIQNPSVSGTSPTTCNGTDGIITISGVMPNATYSVSYTDDVNPVGLVNFTANASGQIIITGLNAGIYSNFKLVYKGNTILLNSTVTLSNIVVIPKFKKVDAFCSGSTPPVLPTTSQNGITGLWNPAVINNQTSATYTFTPDAGQCATTVTMDVTVNPTLVPTFSFGTTLSLCPGSTPPALYKPSDNGVTGTWNPSAIDNQNSATYTFTPNPNQCANAATLSVTVNPNVTPTFSFGTSLTICTGGNAPSLPATSQNGINGTWSPSTVSNQSSGTYTFTPATGQCSTSTTTFTVTVNSTVAPVFSFGSSLSICAGGSVPTLPTTSSNGVNGTWSPSVMNNQNPGTYTFTPTSGQCANSTSFAVTVIPNVTPIFNFGTSLSICNGGSVPSLPATSANGITGAWSPATVSNQTSRTYTFTPNAGQCALSANFVVTVNPVLTPTFSFGTSITVCTGSSAPALPTTSANGITGTWSPSVIDNQNAATYTFTPVTGQCATTTSLSATVSPNLTPTFSIGTSLTICAGANVPSLPTTSSNGINGSWNPSTINNQSSGTYTFTPSAGQCATTASFTVTVTPNTTPTFGFGTTLSICSGGSVPTLVNTSANGITGTWSPSVVSNQSSGTYIFTPSAGQCAIATNFVVTVNAIVTPTFAFGTSMSICSGASVTLPTTSTNGITGTWSPATINNQTSGTYTFTPNAGQCATSTSITVTVNPNVTPTFSLGASLTICAGGNAPLLPTTSQNGINGTWSPSTVSNQSSGTYTFTAATGQCATTVTFAVTVVPKNMPAFSFGNALTICKGAVVPSLPATSTNGITGTWSPSIVDNQNSATYTFTPNAGQCAYSTNFVVTVNQTIIPTFNFGTTLAICNGGNVPVLPTTSTNGITGTWNPSVVSNQTSGIYTFTPNASQCASQVVTFNVIVTSAIVLDNEQDITVVDGAIVPANTFTGVPAGVSFSWTNSNSLIGLGASGTGDVPSFTATNPSSNTIKGTITVTPAYNGCTGAATSYVITVMPLDKDIFVANVFTPNGDGKNDMFFARSNYIKTIELRIFNQFGQQVEMITDPKKGWNGKYRGVQQPSGVYMYTLKATMADGRIIQQKGNVTLLR